MSVVVLDASAILAYLQGEPGEELVARHLQSAIVSAVNLCEVIGLLSDRGLAESAVDAMLSDLALEVIAFDVQQGKAAGYLRSPTRRPGLSLGDRACLALARVRGVPALTADRAWAEVDTGVEVRMIR